jgi:hypothetical protein
MQRCDAEGHREPFISAENEAEFPDNSQQKETDKSNKRCFRQNTLNGADGASWFRSTHREVIIIAQAVKLRARFISIPMSSGTDVAQSRRAGTVPHGSEMGSKPKRRSKKFIPYYYPLS